MPEQLQPPEPNNKVWYHLHLLLSAFFKNLPRIKTDHWLSDVSKNLQNNRNHRESQATFQEELQLAIEAELLDPVFQVTVHNLALAVMNVRAESVLASEFSVSSVLENNAIRAKITQDMIVDDRPLNVCLTTEVYDVHAASQVSASFSIVRVNHSHIYTKTFFVYNKRRERGSISKVQKGIVSLFKQINVEVSRYKK